MPQTKEQKALKLKQECAVVTMFTSDNDGYTLSEETATKLAVIICEKVMSAVGYDTTVWHEYNEIKNELLKM